MNFSSEIATLDINPFDVDFRVGLRNSADGLKS